MVAIILIIAAIAIPNLLRARIAANEASAVNAIRNINTAEFAYNTAYPIGRLCRRPEQPGRTRSLHSRLRCRPV